MKLRFLRQALSSQKLSRPDRVHDPFSWALSGEALMGIEPIPRDCSSFKIRGLHHCARIPTKNRQHISTLEYIDRFPNHCTSADRTFRFAKQEFAFDVKTNRNMKFGCMKDCPAFSITLGKVLNQQDRLRYNQKTFSSSFREQCTLSEINRKF